MKKVYSFLFVFLTIILLIFVLRGIDYQKVYELLKTVKIGYFVGAFFCLLFSLLFWNLRWQNTMEKLQKTNYSFLLVALFAGLFINTITPGASVGGEPLRAYILKKKYKKPAGDFFAAIIADKLFYFLTYSILLSFSLLYTIIFFKINLLSKLIFGGIFLITVLIMVYVMYKTLRMKEKKISKKKCYFFRFIQKRFQIILKLQNYFTQGIRKVITIFRDTVKDRKRFVKGITYSIILLIFKFGSSYFLFLSLGWDISILTVIVVLSISSLFGDISPIPGGLGIMEGAIFLLFSSQGILPEVALSIALLNRVILLFYSLVIGGLCLIYSKWKLI